MSDTPVAGVAFAKPAVAASFSRAAPGYDGVAEIQRTVGGWLMQSIQRQQELTSALDVGCGSGALTAELARRLPMADVDAIDIAEGMLDVAATTHPHPRAAYYVGDAEAIPFDDKSFELVFCNFVLQWCPSPVRALTEMRRVLRRNGQLVLSLPGSGTLAELAGAWREADGGTHVHPFADADTVAEWVDAAGFAHVDIVERTRRLQVDDARTLMRELKTLGAHNLHPARAPTLTGKGTLARMLAAYERRREAGGLPVTWKILMVTARR
ncbi:MAG: malonyl-ACP O-methyltransferase BioC [Pseudomonadota bacterium]